MKKIFIFTIAIVSMVVVFYANSKINANDGNEALLQSANEKISKAEFDAAAEDFKKVISLDDKNSNAYSGLGTCYVKKRDYDKAEQYFNKAISLDENNLTAYIGLGYVNLNKGNLDEAVKSFKKAISLNNKMPCGYEGLIRTYASYKDKDYRAEILSNMQTLKEIDNSNYSKLAEILSNEIELK